MARSRSALLALLLLTAGLFIAARPGGPTPSSVRDRGLYLPVALSARWTYRWMGDGREPRDETKVTTAVEPDGEAWVVTVAAQDAPGQTREYKFRVTAGGLTRVFDGSGQPPMLLPLFTLPLTPGERWENGANTTTVRGVERVRVPAGSFDAVRVERHVPLSGTDVYFTDWYAKGIGVVQMAVRIEVEGNWSERVGVLTSFTPGEERAR